MFSEEDKKSINVAKGTLIALYNKKVSELKDPALSSMLYENCIISGGCISSILLGGRVNDIDIYCKKTAKISDIATHIKNNSDLIKDVDDSKYTDAAIANPQKLVTMNAITLKNDLQLITYMSEEEGARKNFDFIHCTPYYDIATNKLYISEAQLQAIKSMKLVPNKDVDTITVKRLEKFKARGWRIDDELNDQITKRNAPFFAITP